MALTDGIISQWPVNNSGVDTFGGHDMASVSPSGYVAGKIGQALIYDGFDDKSVVSHNSAFNFGDGVTDSPFTIAQWVKMTDATRFRGCYKNIDNSNAEYGFATDAADKLTLLCFDQDISNKISRASSIALTSLQGTYILIAASYDGSGLASGIKLYVGDGASMNRVVTTDTSTGSYTAMHPLTGDMWIGAGQYGSYANGDIDVTYIWGRALSDGSVAEGNVVGAGSDIDLLWNGGSGVEVVEVVAAAGEFEFFFKPTIDD